MVTKVNLLFSYRVTCGPHSPFVWWTNGSAPEPPVLRQRRCSWKHPCHIVSGSVSEGDEFLEPL